MQFYGLSVVYRQIQIIALPLVRETMESMTTLPMVGRIEGKGKNELAERMESDF